MILKLYYFFTMKIKRIQNKDRKKVVRLMKMFFPKKNKKKLTSFVGKKRKKEHVLRIEKNKKFLGMLLLSSLGILGIRFVYLKFFAVQKQKRDKGIGTEALKKLEKETKNNHDYVFLTSDIRRKKAQNFYKKNGFKRFFGYFFIKKLK